MTLKINTLKSAKGSKKRFKRYGRGNASGIGTYSGRGLKGQKSRSGGKGGLKLLGFKATLQATPKLRGFKTLNEKPVGITLAVLEKKFNDGDKVNLPSLKEKKVVGKNVRLVKILFKGELTKKLEVEGIKTTAKAGEAIKKAGGSVKQ